MRAEWPCAGYERAVLMRLVAGLLLTVVLAGAAVHAPLTMAAERLNDTSLQKAAQIDLRWSAVDWRRGDADPSFYQMRAEVPRVEYRLDMTQYVGRNARVFYVLPGDPGILAPQGLTVRWTSQNGLMRSGEARAGERTAVYEGRISSVMLDEVFDLNLLVDSRYFTGRFRLNPYFEIELY